MRQLEVGAAAYFFFVRVCNALRLDRAEGFVFLPPKRLVIGKCLKFLRTKISAPEGLG